MKKSKIIILSLILICVAVVAVFCKINLKADKAVYVKSASGASLFISEKSGEPVAMSKNPVYIRKANTGDRVIVIHGKEISETYPAVTDVYLCVRIKSGYKEVNSETYPELARMGWIEVENESLVNEVTFRYSRMRIPENWKAEDKMMSGSYYCDTDAKRISPKKSYNNGYMTLAHYPQNNFTPAAAGLSEKEITLTNGMKAKVCYYSGSENWKYVSIPESDGYVFENAGLNKDDSFTALEIIKSISFSK